MLVCNNAHQVPYKRECTLLVALQTVLELEPMETGPSIEMTGRLSMRRNSFQAHARLHDDLVPMGAGTLDTQTTAQDFSYKLLEGGVRFSRG